GLAYFFTDQIEAILADVHRAERWAMLAVLLLGIAVLAVVMHRFTRRAEERIGVNPGLAEGRPLRYPVGHEAGGGSGAGSPGAHHADRRAE
ncbi:MAG TPA: hypothetical protein VF653_08225, partial [Methylomirabilota bacterium]